MIYLMRTGLVLAMFLAIAGRWALLAIFYSSGFLAFVTMFSLVFLEKGMDRLARKAVALDRPRR